VLPLPDRRLLWKKQSILISFEVLDAKVSNKSSNSAFRRTPGTREAVFVVKFKVNFAYTASLSVHSRYSKSKFGAYWLAWKL
jgi:hypothetical protein